MNTRHTPYTPATSLCGIFSESTIINRATYLIVIVHRAKTACAIAINMEDDIPRHCAIFWFKNNNNNKMPHLGKFSQVGHLSMQDFINTFVAQ